MHQKTFRRFMRSALDSVAGLHQDPLPADILEAYKLPTLEQALEMIHFPKSPAHMKHATKTICLRGAFTLSVKNARHEKDTKRVG